MQNTNEINRKILAEIKIEGENLVKEIADLHAAHAAFQFESLPLFNQNYRSELDEEGQRYEEEFALAYKEARAANRAHAKKRKTKYSITSTAEEKLLADILAENELLKKRNTKLEAQLKAAK